MPTSAAEIKARTRRTIRTPFNGFELVIRKLIPQDFILAGFIPATFKDPAAAQREAQELFDRIARGEEPEKASQFVILCLTKGVVSPRVVATEAEADENSITIADLGVDAGFVIEEIEKWTAVGQEAYIPAEGFSQGPAPSSSTTSPGPTAADPPRSSEETSAPSA